MAHPTSYANESPPHQLQTLRDHGVWRIDEVLPAVVLDLLADSSVHLIQKHELGLAVPAVVQGGAAGDFGAVAVTEALG